MINISEYLAELALNVFKDSAVDKIDEIKLRRNIKKNIEGHKKYFEMCSLAEEYDFQGLLDYISNNFMDDIKKLFRSTNSKEIGNARKKIIDAAIAHSSAATEESKKQVRKLIENSLDIAGEIITSKISLKDYYLVAEAVDSIKENTDEIVLEAEKRITQKIDEMKFGGSLFSYDTLKQNLDNKDYLSIEKGTKQFFETASLSHPLNPMYRFEFRGGNLVSVPRDETAAKHYPPRFNFKGSIRVGNNYFNDSSVNPLDYAYRHQLKLVMSIDEAKKYLGNIEDPVQGEAQRYVGKEIILEPDEFPPASPYAIKVGDTTFYEYIEFRTKEILDDGTYIIDNSEQTNICVCFEIRINFKTPKNLQFKFGISNATNRELLHFNKFVAELNKKKDLHCYHLGLRKDIIAGIVNDFQTKTVFSNKDEEIDFLERVCVIEDYFKLSFTIPEIITEDDYQTVMRISELIKKDKVEFKWKDFTLKWEVNKSFIDNFQATDIILSNLSYVGTFEDYLFGNKLEYKLMETFNSVRLQEPDRIKGILHYLKEGETIHITYIPGENNICFVTLKIPEKMLGVS